MAEIVKLRWKNECILIALSLFSKKPIPHLSEDSASLLTGWPLPEEERSWSRSVNPM
jgi:hypothetical protein